MTEYRRAFSLSWVERWLLIEAVVAYILVQIGLYSLSFQQLHRYLTHWSIRIPTFHANIDVSDVEWAANVSTAILPGDSTCLVKALTATAICRRHELPADLQIGVATDADGMTAHAWVDVDGEVIGSFSPDYTTLPLDEAV